MEWSIMQLHCNSMILRTDMEIVPGISLSVREGDIIKQS